MCELLSHILLTDRKNELKYLRLVKTEGDDEDFEWNRENIIAKHKPLELELDLTFEPIPRYALNVMCMSGTQDDYVSIDSEDAISRSLCHTCFHIAASRPNALLSPTLAFNSLCSLSIPLSPVQLLNSEINNILASLHNGSLFS